MVQQMHAQMGGAVSGKEELIPAGAVTFGLMYRTNVGAKGDEGICIHVYGNDMPGEDKELLRLDCFKYDPHYHYRNAAIKKNERLMLDYTAEGSPVAWALDKIRNRLPVMLLRCEAEDVARKLDQRDVDAALPKIVAWAESKTRQSYTPSSQG
jgi:hypothetical protein